MYNSGFRSNKKTPDGVGTVASQAAFVQKSDPSPAILSWSIQGSDDRALDPAGGQTVVVNGAGFTSGMTVTVGTSAIGAVTIVNSSQATFTAPAKAAGNYTLTMANSNGQAAILVPGLAYSTVVTWSTAAGSIGSTVETTAFTESVVATADSSITYALASGTLPTGATLNANGTITGTAVATASPTTYSFSIIATDAELQDSTQSFTITVNPDSVTWVSPANGTNYSLTGNQAMSNVTLSATAASGYGITYAANALPTGVTLSGNTISGTPTVAETVSTLLTATANTTSRSSTSTVTWVVTIGDIYWPYVSLLLNGSTPTTTFINDASLNNAQLTIAGDTKPNNFTPYQGGYYSNYFDGTGDYLTITNGVIFGSGAFTAETWFSCNSFAATTSFLGAATTTARFSVRIIDATTISLFGMTTTRTFTVPTLQPNTWYHFAAVRDTSNNVTVFINGVRSSTGMVTDAGAMTGATTTIGAHTTLHFPGYLSNLRIVVGTAMYDPTQSTITVPSSPLTAVANTQLLTCQSPRLVDSSNNNFTLTKSGDTKVTSAYPFAVPTTSSYNTQYSTYFGTKTDYISTPATTALTTFTGDFTFECWVFPTDTSITYWGIWDSRQSGQSPNPMIFTINPLDSPVTGQGRMAYYNGTWYYGTTVVNYSQWTHVAFVRSGSTMTFYVNGVAGGTATISGTQTGSATTNPVYIGTKDSSLAGYGTVGSISNFRIVNGTAVYTANFTPSTTPLTAVANTALLTCQNATLIDNSANARVLTSSGTARPIAQSPFTMTTSTNSVTSLGSTYFDGNGDSLTVPNSPAPAFGTGDFTVQFWVYPTVNARQDWFDCNTSTPRLLIYYDGTNIIYYSTSARISGGAIVLNSWQHIAVSRSSGSTKMFVNGIQVGSTFSDTINYTSSAIVLGRDSAGATYVTGHMSDVQVIKGTGLYTSNFLPPQVPLSPVTNTQLLTCQYNGGASNNSFLDQSSFNNIVTRTGNATQGTFSPFSQTGWSTYYNGSNSYQYVPTNAAFAIGTADFTVEAWVYPTTTNQQYSVIFAGISYGSSSDWGLYLNESTISSAMKPSFLFANGGSAFSSGTTVSVGAWTHIAVARQGTTVRFFINGALTATTTSSASLLNSMQKGIGGGFNGNGSTLLTGYISNLRVVSGTAVYTSAFTPPTSPLTPIAGTILLTNQSNRWIDNSSNNFAITTGGTPTVQAYSPFGGVTSVPTSYSNYFDGTGDYLSAANNAAFSIGTNAITIEGWLYVREWKTAGILSCGYDTNFHIQTAPTNFAGVLYFWIAGTAIYVTLANAPALNTWFHFACVRESGGAAKIYINGVAQATGTLSGNGSSGSILYVGASSHSLGENYSGNISNLRFVKGTAVYTTNFTPSTAPLTTTSQGVTASQVSLLTCQSATMIDNSPNYFTITATGNTAPRPFNPFGTTNTTGVSYTPAVNSGSMYFDGNTDYLSIPYNLAISQTGQYTLEFWFYPTYNYSGQYIFAQAGGGAFGLNWTGTVMKVDKNGVGIQITGSTTLPLNAWAHYAMTYDGTTTKVWANGVLDGSVSGTGGLANVPTTLGYYTAVGTSSYQGYLSDVRFTPGTALYTSNFYPGSAPATPTTAIGTTTYASSLLVNGTSGGIIDYHSSNDLETVGNTQLSPQDPYGGAYYSNYSDGNGDYLTVPSASWSTFAGTFTVEYWIRWNIAPATSGTIAGVYTNGGLTFYNDGTRISPNIYGSGNIFNSTFLTASVVPGKWYHLAITRDSSNLMTMWVDGVSVGSTTTATTYTQGTYYIFSFNNTNLIQGNISNFRVNNTCLYTTTFTPSTIPLTAIAGTQLLTCQSNSFKDNSTNAATLTPAGTVAVNSANPFQQNTGKSLYFDGTGDYLAFPTSYLPTVAGVAFTLEFWIYPTRAYPSDNSIISSGNIEFNIVSSPAGQLRFDLPAGSTNVLNSGATSVVYGTWNHVALVRTAANAYTLYLNGVNVGTGSSSTAITTLTTFGYRSTSSLQGYISDLRVTNGVARYTTTFNPPTTPDQTK